MSFDVKYTEKAISDLDSIYEYILNDLSEPKIAESTLNLIRTEIKKLNKMPLRFKVYDDEPWRSRGLRYFSVKKYMIFYLPEENNKTVTIISIMYGARNIQEQLKKL